MLQSHAPRLSCVKCEHLERRHRWRRLPSKQTTFNFSVLFSKWDNPVLFVTVAGSILSICPSTCPVGLKGARMDRRKDRPLAIWLQLLKCAWETAKRDRATKVGQKESALNGVHMMCVCSGGSKDERCQQFFFRVPISICIFSIPHKQQRKEEMLVQNQIDKGTMVAWRVIFRA